MNTFESVCRKLIQTRLTYDAKIKTSELVLLVGSTIYRQMLTGKRKSVTISRVSVKEITDFNVDPFTIILTTKLNLKSNDVSVN